MKFWILFFLFSPAILQGADIRSIEPSVTVSAMIPGPGCEDGIVLDDGSMETGYGWVSSAVWGEYVQEFPSEELGSTILDSLCVCWTRTREDEDIDFEVVVYKDFSGIPGNAPIMVFPARATHVPVYGEGAFYEVDFQDQLPPLGVGTYHIGVRWNPSVDQFFFLCADQNPGSEPVPGFFRDDRSDGEWGSILETSDPMFQDHAAIMIRPRATRVGWVPTLSFSGKLIWSMLLLISGCCLLWAKGRSA